jgi:hypothetical protein
VIPHTVTREIRLPRPVARVPQLLEHCQALLARFALTAPVCAVRVAILATAPASGEQGDLLSLGWRDPAAADAAFARLRAELGEDVVVHAVARDAHRPERTGNWARDSRIQSLGSRPSSTHPGRDGAALRLLDPPEAVDVEWAGGELCALWWRERRIVITDRSGPERLSGEWWADHYARDYWRCATDDAGELLLYREASGWYVQGWYD